jgi:hypothetical protein
MGHFGLFAQPQWIARRPADPEFYIGIGMAKRTDSEFHVHAKRLALDDLISEIEVQVSSSSVLKQIDAHGKFSSDYASLIKTEARNTIDNFEMVDSWSNDTEYWVYYRLSKTAYQAKKENEKKTAILIATDNLQRARKAEKDNKIIPALNFYFASLRNIEQYLNEAIFVKLEGQDYLIANEIISSVRNIIDGLTITVPDTVSQNFRLYKDDHQKKLPVVVIYNGNGLPGIKVRGFAMSNEATSAVTDQNGIALLPVALDNEHWTGSLVDYNVGIETSQVYGASSQITRYFVTYFKIPVARFTYSVSKPSITLAVNAPYVCDRDQLKELLSERLEVLNFAVTVSGIPDPAIFTTDYLVQVSFSQKVNPTWKDADIDVSYVAFTKENGVRKQLIKDTPTRFKVHQVINESAARAKACETFINQENYSFNFVLMVESLFPTAFRF